MNYQDLKELDASKYLVVTGIIVDDVKETITQMNEHFAESGLFQNDCKVTDLVFIEGNVLGSEGRSDWLIALSGTTADVHPIKRITEWSFVKWLGDFIANYEDDYVA